MAVNDERAPVRSFPDWYESYDPTGDRDGCLEFRGISKWGDEVYRLFLDAKREMDARVHNYEVLEKLADNEVISPKADLPNVSSGDTAGLVRRTCRALVQNTPNVEVVSKFDDDKVYGIFSRHVLTSKIIGSDEYSNDMQQNLLASTKTAFTLGFACVIPVLLQKPDGSWYIHYDPIHYRDVFPEPGAKDVRRATYAFVRRYMTRGEIVQLILGNVQGWDHNALRKLIKNKPPGREQQSVDRQSKKRGVIPEGYEIITYYTSDGSPFLTFSGNTKMLLRIEKNKHPLKEHPVHFLVLEKDENQPLGKSQIEQIIGRQEFADLMLNGAMKLWYRNINPPIFGYGTVNAVPNLGPGKYTQISNPNAKVEPFEVNTQTLMQYGQISQQNLGSMVSLVGSPDQQMAATAGNGMSQTPQGVEAQQTVVDVTTNGYQKAIEAFFSHYCSYALTLYFHELAAAQKVSVTADARKKLLEAGFPTENIEDDGTIDCEFSKLATQYWVRCIPGSLVELEDEKQMRVLGQLFVPLSQAMPAIAAAQDQQMLQQAAKAMSYIIGKQIELSGASSAKQLGILWNTGDVDEVNERDARISFLEEHIEGMTSASELELQTQQEAITALQEQVSLLVQNNQMLLEKLGATNPASDSSSATSSEAGVSSVSGEVVDPNVPVSA